MLWLDAWGDYGHNAGFLSEALFQESAASSDDRVAWKRDDIYGGLGADSQFGIHTLIIIKTNEHNIF